MMENIEKYLSADLSVFLHERTHYYFILRIPEIVFNKIKIDTDFILMQFPKGGEILKDLDEDYFEVKLFI